MYLLKLLTYLLTVYAYANSIRQGEHDVGCQSFRCPFGLSPLTPISYDSDISILSGEILMKLDTNLRHLSGHCWKVFHYQRSQVKVITRSREFVHDVCS